MMVSKIVFERRYSDDSGVEYAVRYDRDNHDNEVEVECINTISIPIREIDWFVEALQRVKQEHECGQQQERQAADE